MNQQKRRNFLQKRRPVMQAAAALTALFIFLSPMSSLAAVLGTPGTTTAKQLAQGTVLYTNTFDGGSVGQQTEHYVAYTPNPNVVPVLNNGYSVYGKRTLTQANQVLNARGSYAAAGINADFFSFQTGVPMSNVIIDGQVYSKDSGWLPAVGFREDGSAFMGTLPIVTTMTTSLGSITVECLNKYRQPYALYLYSSVYGDSTHASGQGTNIVLGSVSSCITLNSTVTAVVESVTEDDGSVPIPEGKLVLSVDASAAQEIKDRLQALPVGSTVSIRTEDATHDARWESAKYALGAQGGKLITGGNLDYTDESAAPRTALGIRADGTVLFYTIDGRQTGYSYGARKETVARRLLELGCVEAINLDGGGSTTIGGTLPGTTDFRVFNSPSDGGLRSCANFFFLKKNNAPSGIPYVLNLSDWGKPVLSGSSIQLRVESAYDTSYGPATVPQNVTFYLEKDAATPSPDGLGSGVYENGFVTVRGNGDVYVAAKSGDAYGSTLLRAVATPEQLRIFNANTGEGVSDLVMNPGDSIALSATAYWGGEAMVVANESFTWRVISNSSSIGSISDNGVFTAGQNNGATGIVAVNAGLCTAEIPVRIRTTDEIVAPPVYPQIQAGITDGVYRAALSCTGSSITAENIKLYMDGTPVSFQYDAASRQLTYSFADTAAQYHRFTVSATAENGNSAIKTTDNGSLMQVENPFPDTGNHWAKDFISYMAKYGVVSGSDDGDGNLRFLPDNNMTRTEFAIMLCNYLNLNPDDYNDTPLPFTDTADIPWWAVARVRAVYARGIMQGQLTDYGVAFKPNDHIRRMEYAISVGRLLPKGLAGAPITAADGTDIPFWAKEDLKIATAQGILNGYPDGTLKPERSVTRAEAVKILYTIFGIGK